MNLKNLPNFTDSRGSIQTVFDNLTNYPVGSITIISSVAGTERASHYHFSPESHWILITKGNMAIYERPVGSKERPEQRILSPGDLHYTDSNVEHTMEFFEPNEFLCFSRLPRDSESYEKNTQRIPVSLKEIFDNWPES